MSKPVGRRHQLVLFDIDGTLINTGGAGGHAMSRAFAATCRVENGLDGIPPGAGNAVGRAARPVVVVGDTPLDVACGRANGARTVAVATGGVAAEQLAEAKPDLVLEDLGEPRPFLDFLDGHR